MRGPVWRHMAGLPGLMTTIDSVLRELEGIPATSTAQTAATWRLGDERASVILSISRRREIRTKLLFRGAPGAMGPDEMLGARLTIHDAVLPDTLLAACIGRRIDEVVDPARMRGLLGEERIRAVIPHFRALRFKLETPIKRPTEEEWTCARRSSSTP